jgi:prepilin peptidase CpaA
MHVLLNATFALAAAWAIYTDFTRRRISNYVTFGAAVVALAVRLALGGPTAFLGGLEGWLLGVAVFVVPFALGWMGAADVKLLAAFGALGGPAFALQSALLGCIAGGLMSVVYLMREHRFGYTLSYLFVFARHPMHSALEAKRRMPFGPALAAGAAASMVLAKAAL